MIIIDEQAIGKLIHALKSLDNPEGQYAIRFHGIPQTAGALRPRFIALLERFFPDSEMYFCDDGDAILLAHKVALKECKKCLYEAALLFGIEPAERIGELYELGLETHALLILLEEKTETRRKAEEIATVRQAQEKAAAQLVRKRQEMLALPNIKRDVNALRQRREAPELMIIEDDDFSRRLVENVVGKEYHLTGLASAEDALLTYATRAPDLLFLDINLPDVTGHELLEKIMVLDPDAYVVMLSGNSDRENVMQAMRQGAKGFVAKPFTREKLFQYIERCNALRKETV